MDDVERWVAQAHFTVGVGRPLSLSAAFVRVHTSGGSCNFLLSSLSDVRERKCYTLSLGDEGAPAVLMKRLEREQGSRNLLMLRALREVLERGRLPYPDSIAAQSHIAASPLSCDLDGNRLTELEAGRYRLALRYPDNDIACDVVLVANTPPLQGGSDDPLAYWLPRMAVEGTVSLNGSSQPVDGGTGTFFHARGGEKRDRVVVHLDHGSDIIAYRGASSGEARAIVYTNGDYEQYEDVALEPVRTWSSLYTFHEYAIGWRLRVPHANLDLELGASFANQELVTVASGFPLWHGRCDLTGESATGTAYVEHMATDATDSLSEFFAAIPRHTLRVIHKLLPLPLDRSDMANILDVDPHGHYVRDVGLDDFQNILLVPIREILDRKGKAWRSYAAVVCYYALRGDKWRQDVIDILLALSEVIHTGSLIVDDVEDASPTRRDGPACHVAHGEPIAINAGTFCYFVWQSWLARLDVPDAAKLHIYNLYFEFMRLAHLGQALDIQGLTPEMVAEIESGRDVDRLAKQLRNVYLLKTGAPAAVFARFGAILAGGQEPQVLALGGLFEALGLAFQIMDDVHNLRGFVGDPKHCEDLAQAKVTMLVVHAMKTLDVRARQDLWGRIQRCGREPQLIPEIVATLEQCGAFAACRDEARTLLEGAWQKTEPLLEDSFAKIRLRAFCWYVVRCLE